MGEEKIVNELVLADDELDRGEYAMTLFKIIVEFAPKNSLDVVESISLGPINTKEMTFDDMPEEQEQERFLPREESQAKTDASENKRSSYNPVYASKLHHLDNEAFIMAVTGSWGTGKTKFVELFYRLLQGQGIVEASDRNLDFVNENKLREDEIVCFNSWLYDFYEDPMLPFSRMIIETVCPRNSVQYETAINDFNGYLDLLKEQGNDNTKKEDNATLEERIKAIKASLQACMPDKSQRKVVIIIDELDRCKPTFAIQLLETVKHLFNIRGLVFLFSLDIGALQHCVKKIYGNGFDAIGYLERFFDYNSILPSGNQEKLLKTFAREYELPEDIKEYYNLCRQFNLTPREMKGICSSFYYIKKYSLEGYPDIAKLLYFYILLLKYKFPQEIPRLNGHNPEARERVFAKENRPGFLTIEGKSVQPFFDAVLTNAAIRETKFRPITLKVDGGMDIGSLCSITEVENNDKLKELLKNNNCFWSYILFAKDFEKGIGNILDLHVLEFLFNKVESYSSDIPISKKKKPLQRGDVICFGKWHMKADSKAPEDMEPIEWIVLEVDEKEALVISRYGIDCQRYHEKDEDVTWKTCTLRKWLYNEENEDDPETFYNKAFTKEEKERIVQRKIINEDNPKYGTLGGEETNDKVFLSSIQEAWKYFETDESRMCKPTAYAAAKGAYVNKYNGNCWWWLRSPGDESRNAASVDRVGSFGFRGGWVDYRSFAVRPSLRIHL